MYSPGERFDVPIGSFSGGYVGLSESNHSIEFTVRSSSEVEKTDDLSIRFDNYEELFNLNASPSFVDKEEDRPSR